MGLRLRFSLVLVLVSLAVFAAAALVAHRHLQDDVRDQVVREARLLMEAATSIRTQTLPAFAATDIIGDLGRRQPQYSYHEAALNPPHPRDRVTDWEAEVVQRFRLQPGLAEFIDERSSVNGRRLFIARPIRTSHTGGEVVGAQIVSVAMDLPLSNAHRMFTTFMGLLALVFALVFIVLYFMMGWLILRPVRRMALAADRVSMGDFSLPELSEKGRSEIAVLGASFNRMRRSLEMAMDMIRHPARR